MPQDPYSLHDLSNGVTNLLPELILGLLGHIGGAFVYPQASSDDTKGPEFPKLSDSVDWIMTPDRENLNNLVRLGHYFSQLESFIDAVYDQAPGTGSLYHAALANGLEELLDVYRGTVLEVEQCLFRATNPPPLLSLTHLFSAFEFLLPEAAQIVHRVRVDNLNGAQIMQLLQRRARSGIPTVQACAERLLWQCHRVLSKQIESWMVYGILIDPRGDEFFIEQSNKLQDNRSDAIDDFRMIPTSLPPIIPPKVAESVLFIGKSMRILRKIDDKSIANNESVILFAKTLQELQSEPVLRPAALRFAIETLETSISAMLWELLCNQCDLNGQLDALQAYFLLGKGDLYQHLLQNMAVVNYNIAGQPQPPSDTTSADWAYAFKQSSINSTAELDPFFSDFHLRWFDVTAMKQSDGQSLPPWHPAHDTSVFVPSYNSTWDGLCLECNPKWPMHLLLAVDILRKYCAMWQFMVRLRRAQIDLEKSWADISSMDRSSHNKNVSRALIVQLGQLRQNMAHFVSNVALYLRVDVVNAAQTVLKESIAKATDFNQADAAQRTFIETIVSQSCLDIKQLMGCIESIFILIRRFCGIVQDMDGQIDAEEIKTKVEELNASFRLKHNTVFQLLQSNKLQSGERARGLRQLVVRLNFNRFCERNVLV